LNYSDQGPSTPEGIKQARTKTRSKDSASLREDTQVSIDSILKHHSTHNSIQKVKTDTKGVQCALLTQNEGPSKKMTEEVYNFIEGSKRLKERMNAPDPRDLAYLKRCEKEMKN